jgi:hypothetical protein
MSTPTYDDLDALSRDVALAARALTRGRLALPESPVESPVCPLDAYRHVAGKRAYEALLASSPVRAREPLRASLARWFASFTATRVAWDLEIDEARGSRDSRDPRDTRAAARESRATGAGADADAKASGGGAHDTLLEMLACDAAGGITKLAETVARHAPRVRAARDERRTRLAEVEKRFGSPNRFSRALVCRDVLGQVAAGAGGATADDARSRDTSASETKSRSPLVVPAGADLIAVFAQELEGRVAGVSPDAALPAVDPEALVGSAVRFLRTTEPLAKTLVRRAHRARTGRDGLAAVDAWRIAAARETRGADWPARLGREWVAARFSAVSRAGKAEVAFTPPRPSGASSFLLAARLYGVALHRSESLRFAPFPLAHDPYFVDAHRTGELFALALSSDAFLVRELGTSRNALADLRRELRACQLFEARTRATALLVACDGIDDRVRETDAAVGGPFALVDFFAPRPHDDEPARWLATLDAVPYAETFVSAHDEDWYRNPRASRALESRFALPALATTSRVGGEIPDPQLLSTTLTTWFEKELG